jgi:thiol-disulfide isomerase/thioredoxin
LRDDFNSQLIRNIAMKTTLKTWSLNCAANLICFTAFCWAAWAATPPNDNFADAELITIGQTSVTGSNIDATREDGEPDHAANQGGASVWWKIILPESGYITLSTEKSVSNLDGQPINSLLAVYTGSDLSNLVVVAANNDDDETGEWWSRLRVQVTGGTEYYIAVDGYSDGTSSPDQGRIVLEVSFSKTITYKPAPAWQLPDLQGKMVKSSDFTNHVVLLNFWATWCAPCVAEIADLIALQEQYRNLGLVVVGISIDKPVDNKLPISLVGTFARDHAINYPVVMTRPGGEAVETDYDTINYLPTTVIIDRKNNIVRRTAWAHKLSEFEQYVLPWLLDSIALRARRADGVVILEWPTVPAQVRVQYSDQLPATSWNLVTGTAVEGAETTTLSLDPDASTQTRFYRLEIVP